MNAVTTLSAAGAPLLQLSLDPLDCNAVLVPDYKLSSAEAVETRLKAL
jgi:hypothetical protein